MIGKTLGAYRIESELGSGGMGSVYLATAEGSAPGLTVGDRVALKVVHHHLLSTPGFFKRFLREAELGRQVDHPNVVRTLDVDATMVDGRQTNYIVMEAVRSCWRWRVRPRVIACWCSAPPGRDSPRTRWPTSAGCRTSAASRSGGSRRGRSSISSVGRFAARPWR